MSHLPAPATALGRASPALSAAFVPGDVPPPTAAPAAGSVRLKGAELKGPCHACAFFGDTEEEYKVLLPFAKDCEHCGERCLQFLDPAHEQERHDRLSGVGIDVAAATRTGHFELRNWDNAYLRGGHFDADDMLALIEDSLRRGRSFGRTRLWANMEWALKGVPGCEQLVEYESRLNPLIDAGADIVICVYQHHKFDASLVMDILRAHPYLMVGGELQHNPLYVPTERFLEDLAQRRAPRPGLRSDPRGTA